MKMMNNYPKQSFINALVSFFLLFATNFAGAQCDAPTNVNVSDEESTSAVVTWNASPSENGGEYQYEVRTFGTPGSNVDPGLGYVLSGSTADGILATTVEGLAFSTEYFFYVRYACGPATFSPWTNAATFSTTQLLAPVALPAIYVDDDSFLARWLPSAGASGYRLDVSLDPDFASFLPGYEDLPVSITSHVVSGLTPMTTYYYRVRAEGTGGSGFVTTANSNIITVTTLDEALSYVVWTEAGWSSDPLITLDAIIDWDYDTAIHQVFEARSLTINHPYTLTISTGTYVIVENEIINASSAEGIVVRSNGNLLQINDNATNVGDIFVNRDSSPLYRLDYTMWSSPVSESGFSLKDFSPMTLNNRFYTYNTTTDEFNAVAPTTTWSQGKGYLIRMPDNHTPYVDDSSIPQIWTGAWQGQAGNGVISVPVSDDAQGFNLVGNPYPSVLSIENFFLLNEDRIDGIVYFWRRRNSTTPGDTGSYYANYTNLGGTASETSAEPNGFIQIGQGFIVKALPGTSEVVFDNSIRVSDNFENQFFRTTTTPERHRLWLNLTSPTGVFSQTLLGYMEGATNGADYGIDGLYINDSDVAFTSYFDSKEYSIQGRALPFAATDVVPMHFKTPVAGSFTIALHEFDGLFQGQNVYLHDVTADVYHDLKQGSYTFSSEAGSFAQRFEIVYNNPQLGTHNPVFNENSVVTYVNNGALHIDAAAHTINDVSIYDLTGRRIFAAKVDASSATFSNINAKGQVLLLEIATNHGTVTKKIIL